MKRGFFFKIAAQNIRNNLRLYLPRVLAEAGLLGCFYILLTLALDSRLAEALGGSYLSFFMIFGAVVIGLLSLILILYVNSFLMKRRRNEYGLYSVLGMEKRHIIRVLWAESLLTSLLSILLGLLFGMLFYKAASLLIGNLLRAEVVAGFYYLSAPTVLFSALVFLGLDLLAFLVSGLTIRRMKPVDLLAGAHPGEKEPRIKWVMLIIGAISLAAGYAIALTVKGPLQALSLFFAAVLLVILGTYFLFVTGTTFLLKCLRRNRRFYYHKRHMPAVAGLLFRMKQNAVGLASIAILATGVLVMISTTVSLYSGVQDTLDAHYPRPFYLSAYRTEGEEITNLSFEALRGIVAEAAGEKGLEVRDVEWTDMLEVTYVLQDDTLLTRTEVEGGWEMEELTGALFITEDTYARALGAEAGALNLGKDEIAFCRISSSVGSLRDAPKTLTVAGKEYRVREQLTHFPVSLGAVAGIVDQVGVVVADEKVLEGIYHAQKEAYGAFASEYTGRIGVTFADEKAAEAVGMELDRAVEEKLRAAYPGKLSISLDSKWETRHSMLDMYGTFLFLGILLGFVCLFSTILIIYYKQISEGYEDRERFQIMEKLGMEAREVRKTIGSQLVLQFFLPLITAAVHTAFAFPILLKLLKMLMLSNTQLFVLCSLVTLGVFALAYTAVYLLTAKTYYKIVH